MSTRLYAVFHIILPQLFIFITKKLNNFVNQQDYFDNIHFFMSLFQIILTITFILI